VSIVAFQVKAEQPNNFLFIYLYIYQQLCTAFLKRAQKHS